MGNGRRNAGFRGEGKIGGRSRDDSLKKGSSRGRGKGLGCRGKNPISSKGSFSNSNLVSERKGINRGIQGLNEPVSNFSSGERSSVCLSTVQIPQPFSVMPGEELMGPGSIPRDADVPVSRENASLDSVGRETAGTGLNFFQGNQVRDKAVSPDPGSQEIDLVEKQLLSLSNCLEKVKSRLEKIVNKEKFFKKFKNFFNFFKWRKYMAKLVVASQRGGFGDQVSQVFGRCQTFTYVDVVNGEITDVEVVKNQYANAMGGAGIQAAQEAANKGAEAVIAGNFGPNVTSVLGQAGVKMVTASGLTVRDAVNKYISGELQEITEATSSAKSGMNRGVRGTGTGTGTGTGRSMGKGMGRRSSTGSGINQPGIGQRGSERC